MNFKKMMKRGQEGFTLVELIVVIAILGILGGIAVPAYSGYVEKANKGADQALIGEVQHALALYYYSNPDADLSTAWVKLSQEGANDEAGETGDLAMKAVFGDDWKESIGLKYADWKGESSALSYKKSSYYGKESSLIKKVDSLTSALGEVVSNDESMSALVIGTDFEKFLKDNKVNTENNGKGVGNAAVLYVAQNTAGREELIQKAFNDSINSGFSSPSDLAGKVYGKLNNEIGSAAALAAVYAYAEGYAQATNQASTFTTDFTNVKNANDALAVLCDSFNNLAKNRPIDEFTNFITPGEDGKSLSDKNIEAYIGMMGTVHNNADIVSSNLNNSDCFTDGTVENMLKGHAAMGSMSVTNPDGTVSVGLTTGNGQVAVGLAVDSNGTVMTPVTPANWNN